MTSLSPEPNESLSVCDIWYCSLYIYIHQEVLQSVVFVCLLVTPECASPLTRVGAEYLENGWR